MGPLAVLFSVLATVWNYVYNIGFDKLLLKYQAPAQDLVAARGPCVRL